MKDENVYRKMDNGRYVPFGVCCEPDNMPDGLWYVRHREHGKSTTSIPYLQGLFKVGDAKQVDVTELCGMEDLCGYIMESKDFRDMINYGTGYSINDIVHFCVKKLVDRAKEQKYDKIAKG